MNDLDDIDIDIDERERQEAEALARALEGEPVQEVPEDAVAVAAFLRAARGAHGAEARVADLEHKISMQQAAPHVRPRATRRALVLVPSVLALAASAFFAFRQSETELVARPTPVPPWHESAEGEPVGEMAAAPGPSASSVAPTAPSEAARRVPGDAPNARGPALGFVDPESESLSYCEQARDTSIEALMREAPATRDAVLSVREAIAQARVQPYAAALDALTRIEAQLSRAPIRRAHVDLLRHALVHERGRLMLAHADPGTAAYLAEAARTFEGRLRNCTGRFVYEAQRRSLGHPTSGGIEL